jgi:hypothetical protein
VAERVVIRQSTATRLLGLGYTSVLGGVAVTRLVDTPGSWVPIVFIACAAAVGYRMWRYGVVADGGGLVVRNTFSTRRLARSEIADFRLDRLRFALPNRQAIRVVLRDGTVRTLDVTKGFRGQPDRAPDLTRLRSWLREGRAG